MLEADDHKRIFQVRAPICQYDLLAIIQAMGKVAQMAGEVDFNGVGLKNTQY